MTTQDFILSIVASIMATFLKGWVKKALLYVRSNPIDIYRCFDILSQAGKFALSFVLAVGLLSIYPGVQVLDSGDMISQVEIDYMESLGHGNDFLTIYPSDFGEK